MSLKAFHILFIGVSTLMGVIFGIWCLHSYSLAQGGIYLFGAVTSFLLAGGLVYYGIWFLRKYKDISFM